MGHSSLNAECGADLLGNPVLDPVIRETLALRKHSTEAESISMPSASRFMQHLKQCGNHAAGEVFLATVQLDEQNLAVFLPLPDPAASGVRSTHGFPRCRIGR